MQTSEEIKTLIEEVINPQLEGHMGCCEFQSFEDGIVKVKMAGACQGCPGKRRTFEQGIKPFIIEHCEGVKDVVLV